MIILNKLNLGSSVLALLTAATTAAVAQGTPADSSSIEEVVVTGTSIRGVAPVGSNLITVGPEDIAKTGSQTVQQLLANVPAITGMGNAGEGGAIHNNYYQPSIHQLGASAANATLVLIDGHRPPTGGTNHSTADPNIIPSNMLERVEVIANGSSATYGSDAVAGVVNFITRKSFDGIQLNAQGTFLDGATNENFGVLSGSSWDKGSVIFAYQFYNQGQLLSKNRPYTNPNETARATATGIPITSVSSQTNFNNFTCQPALVRLNGAVGNYFDVSNATQYGTAQASAPCNTFDTSTLITAEQRNNAMLKLTQDLSDKLTVSADLVIASRRDHSIGQRGSLTNVTVYGPGSGKGTQINPFFQAPVGYTGVAPTSENVYVNLNSLLGGNTETGANGANTYYGDVSGEYKTFGDFVVDALAVAGRDQSYALTPSGTVNTSSAYLALNGTTNTGASTTQISIPGTTTVVTQALTTANALDIWGQGAANQTSAAVKTAILDNRSLTQNIASYQQARLSTNGTLFDLPGGAVKVAVGAEAVSYQLTQEGVQSNNTGPASLSSTHTLFQFHRKVYSYFGEIDAPLVGPDMAIPLVRKFDIDVSGRYDDYSDAGTTTNPKLAFTWEMIDGLQLRGNMSTSFVAPGIDIVGDQNNAFLTTQFTGTTISTPIPVAAYPQLTLYPATFFNGGVACTAASGTCTFASAVQGGFINNGDHHAKPQKGRGWEVGFDFSPTFLPDLSTTVTYWDTQFTGGITGPNIGNIVNNPGLYSQLTLYPNGVSAAFLSNLATGIRQSGSLPITNYFIYYSTNTNFLNLFLQGVDFAANYKLDTDFGQFTAGVTGSIDTKYQESYGVGGAKYSILNTTGANTSFPSIQTQTRWSVGWEQDAYSANLAMNYTGGYRNWSGTSLIPISHDASGNPNGGGDPVKANITFDLHAGYNFVTGMFGEDELSVTVRNLFDTNPPFYLVSAGYDTWAGSPLGREISVSLQAKL